MSTAELIRKHIENLPLLEPFTPAVLSQYGSRKAVDLELARLVKKGVVTRPARGVYVRPKANKYVGLVPPELFQVALAKANGPIGVHGAEAARRLGLSTQVPVQPVYYTTGASRKIRFGKLTINLRHISPRKLVAPGTNVGLAISALWYLGKEQVGPNTFQAIRERLSDKEYAQLKASVSLMPAWMVESLRRSEGMVDNG